jgi:bifunctional UDP-N-acetylglucosamine pyrophosphorylase/glucosamine-1-phosphate N-acetyltransferase
LSQLDLVIVLAAGEGTRMKSTRPKVLHEIAGRSLLGHVLHATSALESQSTTVVVGSGKDHVIEHLATIAPAAATVFQEVRGGTGHAVRLALQDALAEGTLLVCAGDTPLLTGSSLRDFLAAHRASGAVASILTAEVPDPFGYGRIVRNHEGLVSRIVEERDASEAEREITEINSGVYIFDIASLRNALGKITTDNSQKEEYLTDVIKVLTSEGKSVAAYCLEDFTETLGINDRAQLSECSALMRERINHAVMLSGVTIIDPATTWIDVTVEIEKDSEIRPGSSLHGATKVATGAIIGPRTTLIDTHVGQGSEVIESFCAATSISSGVKVGPFAHLRQGTSLSPNSRVGSFVEIKNSELGEGSKVPHLSYVGDATIGQESNIGAATVFVNYDGVEKHRTTVGDHVRIGSDSMLIAPVTIGDGAYTAAGSVITEDVPPGALGLGRARQINILGWVLKKRKGTKSATAAEKKGRHE